MINGRHSDIRKFQCWFPEELISYHSCGLAGYSKKAPQHLDSNFIAKTAAVGKSAIQLTARYRRFGEWTADSAI
jgi:hypothetical protein